MILLVISYGLKNDLSYICQAVVVVILLVINVSFQLYDNKLRFEEIPKRVKCLLKLIEVQKDVAKWLPENYPHLCSPISPCITLQWTYRDNKIVNLPWALLVKDDIILVRAGQVSPGYCESLDKNSDYPLLHAKEVYGPSLQMPNEIFSIPRSRKPLEAKKYCLLETPYLNNLRIALEQSLDRPNSQFLRLKHFVMVKVIEHGILPIMLAVIFAANVIRLV